MNDYDRYDERRRRRTKIAAVAVGVALFLALLALPLVAWAQDGPTQQQNESSSAQQQDVIINQSCAPGAVCNQQATVGGQEPPAPLQANSSAPAVAPVEPATSGCGPGLEWDYVFKECYDPAAEPLGDLSWDAVFGIAGGAFVICVGLVLALLTRPKSW